MSVSACLSVLTHSGIVRLSREFKAQTLPNILCMLPVAGFLRQRCKKLCRPTSRFVDDVMFPYDGPYSAKMLRHQPRCKVYGLTPLLHGIRCVISQTVADAKTRPIL